MRKTPKVWSIVNLTPDSFSDGGKFDDVTSLAKYLEQITPFSMVLDFGAESTAPFNAPISVNEECVRFERLLFPLLSSRADLFSNMVFSIDTYHHETFEFVAKKLRQHFPQSRLIWNDVSSFLTDDVVDLINRFNADYVLCHNLAPKRELASAHMDYCDKALDIISHMVAFFQQKLAIFQSQVAGMIYLDPCFGFSKSYEQNIMLLDNLPQLISQIPEQPWLIGISRKSFLRKKLQLNGIPATNKTLDIYHSLINMRWPEEMGKSEWNLRVHDPLVVSLAHIMQQEGEEVD